MGAAGAWVAGRSPRKAAASHGARRLCRWAACHCDRLLHEHANGSRRNRQRYCARSIRSGNSGAKGESFTVHRTDLATARSPGYPRSRIRVECRAAPGSCQSRPLRLHCSGPASWPSPLPAALAACPPLIGPRGDPGHQGQRICNGQRPHEAGQSVSQVSTAAPWMRPCRKSNSASFARMSG